MTKIAKRSGIEVMIYLDDERLLELFENQDIKPSMAKVKKLVKLFKEVEGDYYEQLEEALEEALNEIIEEEWGE